MARLCLLCLVSLFLFMPQKQTGPTKLSHTIQSRVQMCSLFSQESMVVLMHLAHLTPNPAFSLFQGKCVTNISETLTDPSPGDERRVPAALNQHIQSMAGMNRGGEPKAETNTRREIHFLDFLFQTQHRQSHVDLVAIA